MTRRTSTPDSTAAGITGDLNEATPSSDPVSDAAPGIRTEAEVIADEKAAIEQDQQAAPPGATGNPVINADEVPQEEDDSKLVHYLRESDGLVQSVNVGSDAHRLLENDREFEKTTRAVAKAARTTSFSRSEHISRSRR